MGALSAAAISLTFILYGLALGGWATINGKVLGVIFIIAAALVLIDTFWVRGWLPAGRRERTA